MTNRELRQLRHALFGPVIGALIALAAFGLIQVISSNGASIWWWLSAALVGAIGGFVLASLLAAERDDGEIAEARTAKHGVGDADAPVEGAERRDVGAL
jgi:membrane associated rhomboid family serine protease